MGNPKQKWTSEEEEALRAGVAKHGAGKWKNIQRDPEFNHLLFTRSNIDLKDKWRNLSVANGQILRDKSKTPKAKANPAETPATPLPNAQAPASVTPLPIAHAAASAIPSSRDASTDLVMVVSPRPLHDGNNAAKYNTMIYEALSALKEPNGSDCGAIANYIEKRHEVPQNFRKGLSSRLRRLVQQEKLEKFQNCYKIKKVTPTDTKTPATKQEDHTRSKPFQNTGCIWETVEEAAVSAADSVAEAEKKSFVAARSVNEADRVIQMAEDMESLLQFAFDCFNQTANGQILLMA